MRYELFIALRQIRARKFQTILSVGAIALAVMVLTVSQAVMVGFTGELYNTTVNKLPHVSVSPQEGEDYIYLYRTLIEKKLKKNRECFCSFSVSYRKSVLQVQDKFL